MSNEDEGKTALDYRLDCKMTEGSVYAPTSGLTHIVRSFKKDLHALLDLTWSELLPVRVVSPFIVVQTLIGFGYAAGKGSGATFFWSNSCQSKFSEVLSQDNGLNHRVEIWTVQG